MPNGESRLQRVLENLDSVAEGDRAIARKRPELFVQTPAYQHMLDDKGVLVVGRKGAGKTAVRLGLEYFGGVTHDSWVNLKMEHLDPRRFEDVLKRALPQYPDGRQLLLENTWRYTIGCALMKRSLSSKLIMGKDKHLAGGIRDYLRPYGMLSDENLFRFSPDLILDRVLSQRQVSADLASANLFPIDEPYQRLEQRLMQALRAGNGGVVTVDDLDPCFEKYNEILVPAAEGLVNAAFRIVREYGACSDHEGGRVRIKCFVPRDMFTAMQDRNLDKLAADATFIKWTHATLRNMLARRLSPAAAPRLEVANQALEDRVIHEVFGPTVASYSGKEDTFTCMLFYTEYRPRDILYVARQMLIAAVDDDHKAESVDATKFLHYLCRATEDYCGMVLREYGGKYPTLSKDVEAIREQTAIISPTHLRARWEKVQGLRGDDEWDRALQGMFDAGVIGFRTTDTHLSGVPMKVVVFSYARPSGRVPVDADLVIHPMFWSAYGVSPANLRRWEP